jgi:hypothetical protein
MTALTTHVFKTADESRFDETAGYQDDAELIIALNASTAYWIEIGVCVRCQSDFASRMDVLPVYTGTYATGQPQHVAVYRDWSNNMTGYHESGFEPVLFNVTGSSPFSTASIDNNTGDSSAKRGMAWYSGRITTDTAGDLKVRWRHLDNGGAGSSRPSVVFAGSWIYVTPLNVCPF